ncbi:nuclear transport factor 2 family protein [Streptomyces brasiliscabiei]|uniref:Nuclear transport factor 2 family protein n=1 Tax=Streptomyces brasiliscabiei TaxID=2736302 RepID=A0ABU8G7U4_9ACTN
MTTTAPLRRTLVAAGAAVALVVTAAPAVSAAPSVAVARTGVGSHGDSSHLGYQKSVVARVLKGVFEDGDAEVVDRYVRPDYIQHNPLAPDGTEALKNLGTAMSQQFPDAEYDIKRVISEGNLVVAHSHVILTPGTRGTAVVDIFRFQGKRIAEHWDVGQEVPETSVNGNDMFSTESRPQTGNPGPRRRTAANKALVTKAFDRLLVNKDLSALDRYFGPEYHQHNPNVPNGVQGAKEGLGGYFGAFPQLTVSPKRVIAEGDLVAVHSHYVNVPGDRGQAIVDLFRVRNGKIVEHWDVSQNVPETSANDNTMF